MEKKVCFQDKDVIEIENGEIFEVVGNIHYPDRIFCIPFQSQDFNFSSFFIQKDSKVVSGSPYLCYSGIFDNKVLLIPKKTILSHWNPKKILNSWFFSIMNKGTQNNLANHKMKIVEIALKISKIFNFSIENIGIIKDDLLKDASNKTNIEFNIYGRSNFSNIVKNYKKLDPFLPNFRRSLKIEPLPISEKFASDTKLPLEDCFEILHYQPFRYNINKMDVKLNFVPFLYELVKFPGYSLESKASNKGTCRITAKVSSIEWSNSFPGILCISDVEIKEINPIFYQKYPKITRILIFNRNFLGFYSKYQEIEVFGILQQVNNVLSFDSLDIIETFQLLVGSSDANWEYIRIIHEEF